VTIKYFDCLFVGSVDMDDVGYAGTRINDRRYSAEALARVYDKGEQIARTMEANAFDTLWLAEHHFQPEGYECIPNILMFALHLSHLTERLTYGCGFNITPAWHPLRLAEDYALADILSRGKIRFGVGRGYHTREIEVLGSPLRDQEANRNLFEEQVEVIMKALKNESFSHRGEHYTIPPDDVPYRGYTLEEISLVPRPQFRPFECWQPIQSATPRGLDFMVKHEMFGMMGGGSAVTGPTRRMVEAWQEAHERAGVETELGERLCIGLGIYMADSFDEAKDRIRLHFEENVKMFAPLRLVPALSDQQMIDIDDPAVAPTVKLPTIDNATRSRGFVCGNADDVIASLKETEAEYPGLERIQITFAVGQHTDDTLEQLERFGREVIPAFGG
jgi:alkanesulfonate monooxygenase SsuD/methylene tetrahydromethanopterin reductase-like flavin-dependent oxidoreductase (luciferase family)